MKNQFLLEQLDYLKKLAQFTPAKVVSGEYEIGLGAITELLALIDNPEKKLNIIHVAGTNGKGSTIAFLSQILLSAGYRVGVYTSPALLRATEQIRINNEEISEDDFARGISDLRPYLDNMKSAGHKVTTEFETITVLALSYFLKKNCDFVILECGLGGRTDATNIVDSPLLSVITSIGLDHTEILGDTLEKISFEKAGIIKNNGNVVVMPSTEGVMNVFKKRCDEQLASLHVASFDEMASYDIDLGLKGDYQFMNAALALKCALILRSLGIDIPDNAIRNGLTNASWPCRFEIVMDRPSFIIDGSHNVDGVKALISSLTSLYPDKKIRFIVGVLKDKSYKEMMNMIIPIAKEFYTITVPSNRSLSGEELSDYLSSQGASAKSFATIKDAVDMVLLNSQPGDVICAFGSLYYVGRVREYVIPLASRLTGSAK